MNLQITVRPAVTNPIVLVVMGVSGCGKSTVAALLAGRLGWPLEEGDDLHPRANVEKMAAGHPLTDEDRWPWLEKVAEWVEERLDAGENGIITCSALKRSYRNVINRRGRGVRFVYLAGSLELIAARLGVRHGHFMPASLLQSQFADLEEPGPDEPGLRVEHRAASHGPGVADSRRTPARDRIAPSARPIQARQAPSDRRGTFDSEIATEPDAWAAEVVLGWKVRQWPAAAGRGGQADVLDATAAVYGG